MVSVGDLVAISVLALCVSVALVPSRRSHSTPRSVRFWLSYLVNELPILAGAWLVMVIMFAGAGGELTSPSGAVATAIAVPTSIGLCVIGRAAWKARRVLQAAHAEAFGEPPIRRRTRRWTRWPRLLLWPFPWIVRPHLRRFRNVPYGPAAAQRLDLYVPRRVPETGDVLIHLHSGAFRGGHKNLDAQPLVNRLVECGWVCVSANYRLSPTAVFPDQLIDVKRVIAWVRANASTYGVEPSRIVIAGSSAGGHLAATAALTANDDRFQPQFEDAETSVEAAVCLYPYPGEIETQGPPSSPADYLTADAPPMLVVWGSHDTLVAPVESRSFASRLRATVRRPVVAAELPGAHHCFDLFHSIRCEFVVDAVHAFADAARCARSEDA